MVFTAEQIEEIKLKAVAATKQLRSEFLTVKEYEKKEKEEKEATKAKNPSPKEVLITEAISKIPICSDGKRAVCELITAVTGLTIDPSECKAEVVRPYISLSVMVPTENDNGHNYSLDMPVMMICDVRSEGSDSLHAIQMNGTVGNCLEWEKSGLRPATDDEIDKFFKVWAALSEAGLPVADGYDILGIEKKDEE